jgi:uncharacterized protein
MNQKIYKILLPYILGALGGLLFSICHIPLSWILGPMTFLIVWRSSFVSSQILYQPPILKNGSFIILGISFGLAFTKDTFLTVGPYLVPFLITTIFLIIISILNGLLINKLVDIDKNTSIFASIPGGLTEMVAASESLHANSSLVTIFQTVRLLTVVFFVPFSIQHLFEPQFAVQSIKVLQGQSSTISYGWFFLAGVVGWLLNKKVPAAFVIGPLLTTAILNIVGVSLPTIHDFFLIFAQMTIGIGLGLMISFHDLKLGGKYCGYYFATSVLLIGASFGLGYLFSLVTDLDLATAMLSLAPGGLVEMVLTASSINADPAVVSSLQFIRLLFIISFIPSILKYWLNRPAMKEKIGENSST